MNRQAKFPGPLLKKAREALSSHGPSAGEFRSAFTRVLGSGKGRADVSEFEIGPDEWLVLVSCDVALALGEVKLRQILASKSATPQELAEQIVVAGYKERGAFTAAAVLGPAA